MKTPCTIFICVYFLQVHVQECKTQKVYHWYFDSSHSNEVSRDPQAKLAKANWMSDSIAGT